MRVRAEESVDTLHRDGEALVLLPHRVVRISGLGPLLLELTSEWTDLTALTEQVIQALGRPEGADPEQLVREAASSLAEAGLLQVDG